MTALYWCLGIGGVVLLAIKLWPSDDEDKARAKRFASDNGIPEQYVSIPTGRRTPRRELPEIVSRYKEEVSRG